MGILGANQRTVGATEVCVAAKASCRNSYIESIITGLNIAISQVADNGRVLELLGGDPCCNKYVASPEKGEVNALEQIEDKVKALNQYLSIQRETIDDMIK